MIKPTLFGSARSALELFNGNDQVMANIAIGMLLARGQEREGDLPANILVLIDELDRAIAASNRHRVRVVIGDLAYECQSAGV